MKKTVAETLLTALLVSSCGCGSSEAQFAAPELPAGGRSLLSDRPLGQLELSKPAQEVATLRRTQSPEAPGRAAAVVAGKEADRREWWLSARAPLAGRVHEGETLHLRLWARARRDDCWAVLGPSLKTGTGDRSESEALGRFLVTPRWTRVDVPFTCPAEAGQAELGLFLNFSTGGVAIAGLELRSYGQAVDAGDLPATPPDYPGRSREAAWRAEALARIDEHRKADLTVRVTDAAGEPVKGAEVRVEQVRSALEFGTAVSARLLAEGEGPDAQRYREELLKNFNAAVIENALKWRQWRRPAWRRRARAALDWLASHDLPVRGHNLVWPSWKLVPKDVRSLKDSPAALQKRIVRHVREEAGALRGRLVDWDVVNEPFANRDLTKLLGPDSVAGWFASARRADPDAALYVNETGLIAARATTPGRTAHLEQFVRSVRRHGGPVDGVGIQAHCKPPFLGPEEILRRFDRLSRLGVALKITEMGIRAPDERLQADYLRDVLIAALSHPAVEGIYLWGFWEGRQWHPRAAMFRRDWSPKPAAKVWRRWVLDRWRTDEKLSTDADGAARLRGFLGDYRLTVTAAEKESVRRVNLPAGGAEVDVVLR